uniref:Uncharacterized protein n=1 Tax=Oryza punctata TaxID=4537 RepID=A0A0E0M7C3_ORYPU
MITLITRVEAAICNRQLGSELRLLRFGVRKSSTNLDRSCSDPTVTLRPGSRPLKHTARIRIKKQLGASLLFPFPSLLLHHHHGSAPLLLRSSPHPSRRRSRPWRLPLVRDVSMLCSFW